MNRNGIEKIVAETYLTTHQVAEFIQVNPSSINKWVKEGRITCYRTPGGHRRIQAGNFVAFLTEYKMPVPAVFSEISVSPPAVRTAPISKKTTAKAAKKK